jgi:type IV secretory pathway VirB4 component
MMRKWIRGTKIRTVDPKSEFGRIFKKIGGEWIRISPQTDNLINPLEILNTSLEDDKMQSILHQKINNLKTMFTIMYKDLKDDQVQQSVLEKVLVQLYEDWNITWTTDFTKMKPEDFPTLGDLYSRIKDLMDKSPEEYGLLSSFYQVLYPYTEGVYSKAFNGKTNVDLSNDLIAFDIFDLVQLDQDELGKVAMFNILTYLKDDALKDKELKHIYVDEAHVLADPNNPLAMKFLFNMYKLIRSFGGGVTSATQEVDDFLSATDTSRNYGEAIMYNSSTKLYLAMTKQSFDALKTKASESFSEEEENILVMKDANKSKYAGKGIFVVGSTRVALEVEMTKEELRLWDEDRFYKTYKHETRKETSELVSIV